MALQDQEPYEVAFGLHDSTDQTEENGDKPEWIRNLLETQ